MPETFLINVISLLSLQYYAKRFVISVARGILVTKNTTYAKHAKLMEN